MYSMSVFFFSRSLLPLMLEISLAYIEVAEALGLASPYIIMPSNMGLRQTVAAADPRTEAHVRLGGPLVAAQSSMQSTPNKSS
jgi:hypothetical protein